MAYTAFNKAKPDPAADNGTNFGTYIRQNQEAIRDGILTGVFPGWAYAQSGPTDEPTTVTHTLGTDIVRQVFTWGTAGASGQIASIVSSYSANSGTAYDTIGTATFSYASGEMTAASGGAGLMAKVLSLFPKLKALKASYDAHAALAGTAAHSLASMATQAASSVTISGGTVKGVAIGGTGGAEAAVGTFTIEREVYTTATATTGGTTTITASAAGWFELTLPNSAGTCTIVLTGAVPANLSGGVVINVVTGATVPTVVWDSNIKWPSAVTPTLVASKNNVCSFLSRNNSASYFGSLIGSYA